MIFLRKQKNLSLKDKNTEKRVNENKSTVDSPKLENIGTIKERLSYTDKVELKKVH